MKKSLKINFNGSGSTLDLEHEVSGLENEAQFCLVNLAHPYRGDPLFPERGTRLFQSVRSGSLLNQSGAVHAAGLARIRTLFFLSSVADRSEIASRDGLAGMELKPVRAENRRLFIEAAFRNHKGDTLGRADLL